MTFVTFTIANPAAASSDNRIALPTSLTPEVRPVSVDAARRAGRFLLNILACPAAFFCAFFGIEASIGERRGYVQLCENGCNDVHDAGDVCPRIILADCDLCARSAVELDSAGNCSFCGNRRVLNRRSKQTGKRVRPSTLKLIARSHRGASSSRFPEAIDRAAGCSDTEGPPMRK